MKEQKKPFYCSDRLELDENERCITQCDHCAHKQPKIVQKLIDMMKEDEELGLYDIFNDEKRQGVKELIDKHKQESIVEKMIPLQLKYNLAMLDVMKQESLEEVALRLYPIILEDDGWDKNKQYRDEWIEGAKWQQEQDKNKFSEEEVLEIIRQYALEEHLITSSKPDIWFEQFKKK